MNYIKDIWVIKRWLIILYKLKKIFHLLSNNIDCEIIAQGRMRFKNNICDTILRGN